MSDLAQIQIKYWHDGTATQIDPDTRDDNPFALPKTADAALSLAVMEASKPTPQACWRNSIMAYWPAAEAVHKENVAAGNPAVEDVEGAALLYYVEGQLVMPLSGGGRFAIEHAWLETEEGRVIETTLPEAAQQPGWAYFTGLRLTLSDVLILLRRNQNTLPLQPVAYRVAPESGDAYRTAMRAAYWHAWGVDVLDVLGRNAI